MPGYFVFFCCNLHIWFGVSMPRTIWLTLVEFYNRPIWLPSYSLLMKLMNVPASANIWIFLNFLRLFTSRKKILIWERNFKPLVRLYKRLNTCLIFYFDIISVNYLRLFEMISRVISFKCHKLFVLILLLMAYPFLPVRLNVCPHVLLYVTLHLI